MKEDRLEGIDDMEFILDEELIYEVPEDIDDYDTTTYQDEYSPGDDYETDWINSLE